MRQFSNDEGQQGEKTIRILALIPSRKGLTRSGKTASGILGGQQALGKLSSKEKRMSGNYVRSVEGRALDWKKRGKCESPIDDWGKETVRTIIWKIAMIS